MTYDLITVGRVNMDLFAQDIGAEFADITGFDAAVGGSPTNVAMGTARLGLRSAAFTAVGEDTVGEFVLRYLRDAGVVTDFVKCKPGKRISLALVGVQPPSRFPLTFYRDDPADIHLTIDDATTLPLDETRAILLSGNAFSRGTCADAARRIAERAAEIDCTVFMDLDLRPTDWSHPHAFGVALRSVLGHIDVLIGTEEEFYALLAPEPGAVATGAGLNDEQCAHLEDLIEELMGSADRTTLILKRGGRGSEVITTTERFMVPGFPVGVVNTVGAGDSFASGLITSRLRGEDWYDSCRIGNACGAITVTRHGCAVAFPTQEELEDFVAANGGL
ncbi:MAG: 5-dehydro-2-deoxygluconokinase [Acidimicrobiia bacterium]|nr:5-dehydro-2-deoxygluconokinase [Acidimicrobiia bacterium]